MKNRRRFLVTFIGAVGILLTAIISTFSLLDRITEKMNQRSSETLLTSTRMIQNNLNNDLESDLEQLESCACLYALNGGDTTSTEFLFQFAQATDFFRFSYVDQTGIGISSDGSPVNIKDVKFQEKALSEGVSGYSDAYIGNSGRLQITFQTPVKVGGEQVGALYASKTLNYYSNPSLFAFRGGTGNAYVIGGSEGSWIIEGAGTKSDDLYSFLNTNQNDPEIGQSLRQLLEEGKAGTIQVHFEEEDSLLCFLPMENEQGWYLISILPKSILQKESSEIMELITITILVLVILLVAVILIAGLLMNRQAMRSREKSRIYREQLFQIISANVDFVFLLYSYSGRNVEMVSDNVRFLFGLDPDQVASDPGLLFGACGVPEKEEGRTEFFDGKLNKKIVREYKTGTSHELHRWVEITLIPVDSSQGLAVFRDTTGEHHMRDDLAEALQQSQENNRARTAFFSSVSHDIRTPMNGIVGMTAIAKANLNDSQKVQSCLDKISLASDHLLMLINELLDMSRIESGKMSLSKETVNLPDLISSALLLVKPDSMKKNHTIHIKSSVLEYTTVLGDTLHLQKILLNLLSNAVKYTPDGGEIVVGLQEHLREDGLVDIIFQVEDNGIGMTPEFLDRIFLPYERAEDNRLSKIVGTGLGMAITRNIVDMMGGKISVESELGVGSRFTVSIPLPLSLKEEKEAVTLSGKSVLIVDDDLDACENLRIMLSKTGVLIRCCQNGRDAIASVKKAHEEGQDYFAVIMDWKMEGMDGVEAARRIREDLDLEIPIILLSAYNWEEVEKDAIEAGINGFLTKPIFKADLLQKLRQYTGDSRDQTPEPLNILPDQESCRGLRILLAEDNELNREIAEELLQGSGALVESVENGSLAVQRVEQCPPGYYNMILMDIHMPVMDGLTATKKIRSLPDADAAKIPIIAMTADAFEENIRKCRMAGMNAHIAKPVDPQKLLAVIRHYRDEKSEGNQ